MQNRHADFITVNRLKLCGYLFYNLSYIMYLRIYQDIFYRLYNKLTETFFVNIMSVGT